MYKTFFIWLNATKLAAKNNSCQNLNRSPQKACWSEALNAVNADIFWLITFLMSRFGICLLFDNKITVLNNIVLIIKWYYLGCFQRINPSSANGIPVFLVRCGSDRTFISHIKIVKVWIWIAYRQNKKKKKNNKNMFNYLRQCKKVIN